MALFKSIRTARGVATYHTIGSQRFDTDDATGDPTNAECVLLSYADEMTRRLGGEPLFETRFVLPVPIRFSFEARASFYGHITRQGRFASAKAV